MRNSATAATAMVAKCSRTRSAGGSSGDGSPRGTSPTVATPWSARSNRRETSSPPATSTSAPGTFGATTCNVSTTARDPAPTANVSQSVSPRPRTQLTISRQLFAPSPLVPVSLGSSPMTTSMAAPNRKPVITALDSRRDSQPSFSTAAPTNSSPVNRVMATTSSAVCCPRATPLITAALAAMAASAELGPVEICRDVPNTA